MTSVVDTPKRRLSLALKAYAATPPLLLPAPEAHDRATHTNNSNQINPN